MTAARHAGGTGWWGTGLLALITLGGGALLLSSPGRIGLRGDEAQFLAIATMPPRSMIGFLAQHESHPPLLYLIVHLLADGQRPADAQVMSFLVIASSIALIPATYWLGARSARRSTGLIAAALMAASVQLAFYNVQLRPYAILSLLLLLSVGVMLRALDAGAVRDRVIWSVIALLMLYTHHIAVVLIAAEVVMCLALGMRRHCATHTLQVWMPWYVAVSVLMVPDLLLLLEQARRTGIPSLAEAGWLMPLREFTRLLISFPFELLLPFLASLVLVLRAVRGRAHRESGRTQGWCPAAVSGIYLLISLLLLVSEYRRHILVDYVALAAAPLGLVVVALLLSDLLQARRRAAASVLMLSIAVSGTLSSLFAVGQLKTNIDVVAALVQAEASADDIVLLAPRVSGVAFNRYFTRSNSQVDFPVIGQAAVYRFDDETRRIADPDVLHAILDTVAAARIHGRAIWYVRPAAWANCDPRSASPGREATARDMARLRASQICSALVSELGEPMRSFVALPAPRSMELFRVSRFSAVDSAEFLPKPDPPPSVAP